MITLTESAVAKIKELQEGLEDKSFRLRLFISEGGCSGLEYGMTFEKPLPDDKPLSQDGVDFFVAADSFAKLDGCTIAFDDGLAGKGFEVQNPNATSTCGCGKSFN